MVKKILVSTLFLVLIVSVISRDLIAYGFQQAKGQLTIISGAVPISTVLEDEQFPDSLKNKIKIIEEVRRFAIDSIGLVDSDNYTTFYDEQGKVSLWNLSACEPFSFTPKQWSFPFLGSFPYKGFFDLEKAKTERSSLLAENYDTRIRPVRGWSTLGWFSDPILSNMLERSEGALANLIIHELTHATLFVKNDIQFNENLASFIGNQGALWYLESKYGKGAELEEYVIQNEDRDRFTQHMLHTTSLLDSLYDGFEPSDSDSIKSLKKHILIDEIVASLDTIHFHQNSYYSVFSSAPPNNAYFMSFLRYYSAEDSLLNIYHTQHDQDLASFTQGMKAHHED